MTDDFDFEDFEAVMDLYEVSDDCWTVEDQEEYEQFFDKYVIGKEEK